MFILWATKKQVFMQIIGYYFTKSENSNYSTSEVEKKAKLQKAVADY